MPWIGGDTGPWFWLPTDGPSNGGLAFVSAHLTTSGQWVRWTNTYGSTFRIKQAVAQFSIYGTGPLGATLTVSAQIEDPVDNPEHAPFFAYIAMDNGAIQPNYNCEFPDPGLWIRPGAGIAMVILTPRSDTNVTVKFFGSF